MSTKSKRSLTKATSHGTGETSETTRYDASTALGIQVHLRDCFDARLDMDASLLIPFADMTTTTPESEPALVSNIRHHQLTATKSTCVLQFPQLRFTCAQVSCVTISDARANDSSTFIYHELTWANKPVHVKILETRNVNASSTDMNSYNGVSRHVCTPVCLVQGSR